MRHWPLFAFVLLASCLRTTRAQPATLVLDAETLEAAGVVRLTDLLPLIDAWQAVSLEGYTAALSAGGLAPFQAQAWTVMIDGLPVSPASPGSASLNALPLHVLQIDSVTVVSRPVVVNGVPATAGLLHPHTRRPGQPDRLGTSALVTTTIRTRFSPHPRLCFFGTIRFTSGTRGPAFASVGPSARRPAYLLADLGLQKRLWQEHLRLHLALRNLTNTSYRPHPAGAVTHLSLFAQIEARF
ncbi:MAG: hypothetical protein KatS3mg044_1139 [Rhodothermaceae bacterium]|nr:MAG: hypothetical protein KatS3mg044_1139 [Rhodothermaceae bacterium]